MIVKYTDNTFEEYALRFGKINERFTEIWGSAQQTDIFGTLDTKPLIASLQDYFNNIEYIVKLDDAYFLQMPLDEEPFTIDLNTRTIKVPNHFKKNGIGVAGDKNAEVLFFVVDRLVESIDLNTAKIFIKWATSGKDKKEGIYEAYGKSTQEAEKLMFAWLIDEDIAKNAGIIQFSVMFVKGDALTYEDLIANPDFQLNTLPATLNVNASFELTTTPEVESQDGEDFDFVANSNVGLMTVPAPKVVDERVFDPENPKYINLDGSETQVLKFAAYNPYGVVQYSTDGETFNTVATTSLDASAPYEAAEVIDKDKNMYWIIDDGAATLATPTQRYEAASNADHMTDSDEELCIQYWKTTVSNNHEWTEAEEAQGYYEIPLWYRSETGSSVSLAYKYDGFKAPLARKPIEWDIMAKSTADQEEYVKVNAKNGVYEIPVIVTEAEDDTDPENIVTTYSYSVYYKVVVKVLEGMTKGSKIIVGGTDNQDFIGEFSYKKGSSDSTDFSNGYEHAISLIDATESPVGQTSQDHIVHEKNNSANTSDVINIKFVN